MTAFDFEQLEPVALWRRFGELMVVPRPSKDEGAAIEYVRQWAAKHGFPSQGDAAGNLSVHVPGSPGFEDAAPVIIQGHVDIVVADSEDAPADADSAKGKIPVFRGNTTELGQFEPAEGGPWLGAPYTTLGADNGVGCAAGMAVAEMDDLVHPPLQLLFTIDEEQGMTGALNFDPAALGLTAQRLINLDTEDDTDLTIGCAGGLDTVVRWSSEVAPLSADERVLEITLRDLRGGHSGIEINAGRINANRTMARALSRAAGKFPLRIVSIDGGEKRNAIPRICRCVLAMAAADEGQLTETLNSEAAQFTEQFTGRDGPVQFQVQASDAGGAFSVEASQQLLNLILALPDGVFAMTAEIPDLPETSNNVAVITTREDQINIACCSRSSQAPGMQDVLDSIAAAAQLSGATTEHGNGYPGWKPNVNSALLAKTAEVYRRLFNEEPHILAVHAGLECGVLGSKLPDLDSISFGPNIRGNHAPGEHIEIASVQKSFALLVELLRELAE